jgi:hypothetical protein
MIKHSIKGELLHVSIENMDFSYRIPLQKLGKLIKWRIGKDGTEGIVMKNVSNWMLKLFSNKETDDKHLEQFKNIIQEYAPENSIDWNESILAVNVQHEYNRLKVEGKMEEMEIILNLEEKYKLP